MFGREAGRGNWLRRDERQHGLSVAGEAGHAGAPAAEGTPDFAKLVHSCRIAAASRCWLADMIPCALGGSPNRYCSSEACVAP